jgi:hypothetical protein
MHRRLKESNACAKNFYVTNEQCRHCKPMIIKDLKKMPQQALRRHYQSILQVLFANLAADDLRRFRRGRKCPSSRAAPPGLSHAQFDWLYLAVRMFKDF